MNEQVTEYLRSIAREKEMWSSQRHNPYLSSLPLGLDLLRRAAPPSAAAGTPSSSGTSSSSSSLPSAAGIGGLLGSTSPHHNPHQRPSRIQQAADHSAAMAYRQGLIDAVTVTTAPGGGGGGGPAAHLLQAAAAVGSGAAVPPATRTSSSPNSLRGASTSVSAVAELLLAAENRRRVAGRVLADYQLRATGTISANNAGGQKVSPPGRGLFEHEAAAAALGDLASSLRGQEGQTLESGEGKAAPMQEEEEADSGEPKTTLQESGDRENKPSPTVSFGPIGRGSGTPPGAFDLHQQHSTSPGPPTARYLSILSGASSIPIDSASVVATTHQTTCSSPALGSSSPPKSSHPSPSASLQKAAPPPKKRGRKPGSGKKKKRTRPKKPKDMPRRPLSAYNIFFRDSRARILDSIPSTSSDDEGKERPCGKKPHGKIGFENLAKVIGRQWNESSEIIRERYRVMAEEEMRRYKFEMAAYKERIRVEQEEARKRQQLEDVRKAAQEEEEAKKITQDQNADDDEGMDDESEPMDESNDKEDHENSDIPKANVENKANPSTSPVLLARQQQQSKGKASNEQMFTKTKKNTTPFPKGGTVNGNKLSLPQDGDELLSQSSRRSSLKQHLPSSKKDALLSRAGNFSTIKSVSMYPKKPQYPKVHEDRDPVSEKRKKSPLVGGGRGAGNHNNSGGTDRPTKLSTEQARAYLKTFRTLSGH